MDALQALLGADTNIKGQVYIKRLDTNFTVKALDDETFAEIQEEAANYVGQRKEIDESKLNSLLVAKAVVDENGEALFKNAQLLEKFGAKTTEECVRKALLAGELLKIVKTVMDISGFNDDVEEVKN
jgi:tryptophan synthase beta subunit